MSETKTPYPPSPPDVPEGLSDYADSFARQQNRVLTGLFVFLIFYFASTALFVMLGAWCAATLGGKYDALKVAGLVLSVTFVLFLVKGFFKRPAVNRDAYVEVTDDDHPVLFDFLHQLCDELGAPFPHRVYLCPDVIAEYTVSTSLLNLVLEPRRELLVGVGLVNCTNLSEFKAVLAHEFGQFCHLGRSKSYCAVVQHIVFDLIEGEDAIDRLLRRLRRDPADRGPGLKAVTWPVVYPVSWVLDAGHAVLWLVLKAVALPGRGMVWEQEFHADLVAVSAAGSDALTHALLRARFGTRTFNAALDELAKLAEDRGVYTNDLYLHQDRAAALVRWREGRPDLGLPPVLTEPGAGEAVRVFDGGDDAEDEHTPPMWRGHPANSFREENAKEHFVPAVTDHRSPWLLFDHPADLKERMAYEFYRAAYQIRRTTELTPAAEVQALIDAEYPDAAPPPDSASRILESGELPIPVAAESINLVPLEEQLPVVTAPQPTPARPAAPQPTPADPVAPPVAADELRGETVIDEVIRVIDAGVPPPGPVGELPAPAALAAPIAPPPAEHAPPAEVVEADDVVAFAEAVPVEAAPPVALPASGVVPGSLLERAPTAAEPSASVGAAEPDAGVRVGSDSSLERLLGAAVLMELPVAAGLPDTLAEGSGLRSLTDDSSFSISDPEPPVAERVPAAAAVEPPALVHEAHTAPQKPLPVAAGEHDTAAALAADTLPVAAGAPVGGPAADPPLPAPRPVGSALILIAETVREPFVYPATPESVAGALPDSPHAEVVAVHEAEPEPAPVEVPVAHPTVAFGSSPVAKPADRADDESDAFLIAGAADVPPAAGRPLGGGDQDGSSGGSGVAVGRSEAANAPPPLTPEEEESIYTLDPRGPGGSSLLGGSKPSSAPLVKIGVGNLAATGGSAAGTPSPRPAFGSAPAERAGAVEAAPSPALVAAPVPPPALVAASVFETLVPAAGRRPAVRITFVKPGEKSPIGTGR
ncbi:Peptidase M48, Ste24p OS=Saccharophagus degradans (strain 2-40 / ATCC 43961 / DSM 17024) GN=Sde_3604 PE=4 SV=1 [Gemmataceae bacterium]|nr:Peptidase M48, Ste24p OS=Saccharophagus degradans (strain 2-40 / ATCC 43961 / DSM 17024) GN=Sde_3604 PE=4 SV=1 [Gemmataceae bacterium]VTU00428.1 Peptidase M48, Ste24p OS=Saccharophagus degradans (strain 2-40 / ATCC 43961 / DSM 17024) GN=Sde_3604 PE=4 SV=1 [Gemmataceae bacterium]